MNLNMIAAGLWTFIVLLVAFIIITERVLDKTEENKKK